jgi:succinate dehydrogenase/fumarate reductase-like Fe-S protein
MVNETDGLQSSQVTLVIERGTKDQPSFDQSFEVPFEPGASVLDGLNWIRVHQDPTLAFRFSCISANVCKECVISIDGKKEYACTARMTEGRMRLAPLPNKRRLRDLACETTPPKERIDASD